MRPCVFLDRDGTIIEERHYLSDPDLVSLVPGAAGAIAAMRRKGYLVVVVSNQSGISRGYFTAEAAESVNRRMEELLEAGGAGLDAVYFCPHVDSDGCSCRKPKPGLIERACGDFDVDLAGSYMVGDKMCDVMTGVNAGVRPVLVRTGYGASFEGELPEGASSADCLMDFAAGLPDA